MRLGAGVGKTTSIPTITSASATADIIQEGIGAALHHAWLLIDRTAAKSLLPLLTNPRTMMTLRTASDFVSADGLLSCAAGIHEAGNPYFDYLFGNGEVARTALTCWLSRPSSEVSLRRATLIVEDTEVLGGYIAMSGAELRRCRRADALVLAMSGKRELRAALIQRLEATRDLFQPVGEADYYLSKVWINASARGRGLGKELVSAYLARGWGEGYSRLRLDVCVRNLVAVRLYSSFGFRCVHNPHPQPPEAEYVAMLLDKKSTE